MEINQIIVIAGLAILIILQLKRSKGGATSSSTLESKISKLEENLEREKGEKNALIGQERHLQTEKTNLNAELKQTRKELDTTNRELASLRADQKRRETEMQNRISQLNSSREALEKEHTRISRSDEERQQNEIEERDRIWNDHEQNVHTILTELCQQPEYCFKTYDNNNLPKDFDGKFKPDFFIEFLGQYLIFDSKTSKAQTSQNLRSYISDSVKKTLDKVKKDPRIHRTIFFVVPNQAIGWLKKTSHTIQGFTFRIITTDAIPAILESLKKIEAYEFAEQMDPQDRENLINLIAKLDLHINLRNATDLIMARAGAELLSNAQKLNPEIAEEVQKISEKTDIKSPFKPTEIRRLTSSVKAQEEEAEELTSPKPSIAQKTLEKASKKLRQ